MEISHWEYAVIIKSSLCSANDWRIIKLAVFDGFCFISGDKAEIQNTAIRIFRCNEGNKSNRNDLETKTNYFTMKFYSELLSEPRDGNEVSDEKWMKSPVNLLATHPESNQGNWVSDMKLPV